MKHLGLYLSLTLLFLYSCSEHTPQNFDPDLLNWDLAFIDSINNVLIEEQSDYVPMVIDHTTGLAYRVQDIIKSWEIVREDWNEFVALCYKQKYSKATRLLADKNFQIGVLGHIRHSELRYYFILNILDPLMLDYAKDTDEYLYQYLDWRRNEMAIEMNLVNEGKDIPEHFTNLLKQVGYGYAWNGDFDRALGMVDILDPVIYEVEQDSLSVELNHYVYLSNLYYIDGDTIMQHYAINFFRDSILPVYEPIGSPNYRLICRELEDASK